MSTIRKPLWLCGIILYGSLALWRPAPANAAWGWFSPSPPVAAPAPANANPPLSQDQIQQLVAPVALYPDPLLAQLFPAATYPADVAAAAQWVVSNPNAPQAAIDAQPWDPSVKALVHYPTVLQRMAADPNWTQALGAAFLNQQADVMAAVQALRVQATNAGVLASTPQQVVTNDNGGIDIEPANPDVIYVPSYTPIYTGDAWTFGAAIDFGFGFPCGYWLNSDCDWGGGVINVGVSWDSGWRGRWRGEHGDQGFPRPDSRGRVAGPRPWTHDNGRPRPVLPPSYQRPPIAPERRGFVAPPARPVAPAGGREPVAVNRPAPAVRPGGAFGPVYGGARVQQYSARGRQSAAPVQRAPEQARPVEAAPPPRAAPPSAFHASAPGRTVQQQSARGNASRGRR